MKLSRSALLLFSFMMVCCSGLSGMFIPPRKYSEGWKAEKAAEKVYDCFERHNDEQWLLEVLGNSLDPEKPKNVDFIAETKNLPRRCPYSGRMFVYDFSFGQIEQCILDVEEYKEELLVDDQGSGYNKELFILKSQLATETLQYTLAAAFPINKELKDGFKEYDEAKNLQYEKNLMSSKASDKMLQLGLPWDSWESMQDRNKEAQMNEYAIALKNKYYRTKQALESEIAMFESKNKKHVQAFEQSRYKTTVRSESE